jgi:co-chaperonin GroES (HSP10)
MNYKPYGSRVVGKVIKASEPKSAGGLILIQNPEVDSLAKVEVVAVGRGYFTQQGIKIDMETQVGDIVYVPKTAIGLPKIEGDEYVVFQESDIFVGVN